MRSSAIKTKLIVSLLAYNIVGDKKADVMCIAAASNVILTTF